MTISSQHTGMRGVYLVAAELAGRGFVASPTSRSAFGADILVTDRRCRRAYSVQVKTNARSFGHWLVGQQARDTASPSHLYVLVNLRRVGGVDRVEYYVVPSRVVARHIKTFGRRTSPLHAFLRTHAAPYRDRWELFGTP